MKTIDENFDALKTEVERLCRIEKAPTEWLEHEKEKEDSGKPCGGSARYIETMLEAILAGKGPDDD